MALLQSLIPRLLGDTVSVRFIPFEGKQDLEKQLTRKIRAYQNPLARFVVLRDQDSFSDCRRLKQRLMDLCLESGRINACKVRIACTELETFYLADLLAVEHALGLTGLAGKQNSKKFRHPDSLGNPSQELRVLTQKRYEKIAGSRAMGLHLDLENERSPSFKNLIRCIRQLHTDSFTDAAKLA